MSKKSVKVEHTLEETTDLVEEVILDEVEAVEPAPVVEQYPKVYVCVYGDTYPAIAARFKPAGLTKHQYAQELFAGNAGKSLSAGVEVVL